MFSLLACKGTSSEDDRKRMASYLKKKTHYLSFNREKIINFQSKTNYILNKTHNVYVSHYPTL